MKNLTTAEHQNLVNILESHISNYKQDVADKILQADVNLFNKVATDGETQNVLTVEYVRKHWIK